MSERYDKRALDLDYFYGHVSHIAGACVVCGWVAPGAGRSHQYVDHFREGDHRR
jgi:hypothetical protein